MIQKLVWENMKHRPLRTLLSALLIAIPVTLVLTLAGLTKGLIDDSNKRNRGVGADILIRPKSSSMLSLGASLIPERLVDYVRKQPHVSQATGVIMQSLGSVFSTAVGVDWDEFNRMSGGLEYIKGGPPRNPDEVAVDEFYAQQNKIRVGDMVDLLGKKRRVAGICKPGKLNRVFMERSRLQELTSNTGNLNTIYVKVDDPKNIDTVVAQLKETLPGYPIYPMEEFISGFTYNNIPMLSRFTSVMIGIAVIIGFAVVCLSMYMAVLQRTREIGILKALGASRWYVLNIILREAVLLSVVGTIMGIAMSYLAKWLLETFAPASLPPAIDPTWWPTAAGIAIFGAVLGAVYPGLHAASMDPIEALSYE